MTSTTTDAARKSPAAEKRSRMRVETANIIQGVREALAPDEQLLAFTRGRISGGWRGKLNIGPEAFFAPFVNIGLTDRRVVLQHIHPDSGKPSEILPHVFPLKDLHDLQFGDIESFGGEPAGRLVLHLSEEQKFRIRVGGTVACDSARNLAEVYRAFTQSRREPRPTPTADFCMHCRMRLDEPVKFCPYCGNATVSSEDRNNTEPETQQAGQASNIDDILDSLESNRYEEPASASLSDAITEDAAHANGHIEAAHPEETE